MRESVASELGQGLERAIGAGRIANTSGERGVAVLVLVLVWMERGAGSSEKVGASWEVVSSRKTVAQGKKARGSNLLGKQAGVSDGKDSGNAAASLVGHS